MLPNTEDMQFGIPKNGSSFKEIPGYLNLVQAKKSIQLKTLKVMIIYSIKGKEARKLELFQTTLWLLLSLQDLIVN